MKTVRALGFGVGVWALLSATGAAADKEPSYDGVPLGKWLERANDPDPKVRAKAGAAVDALGRSARATTDALVGALEKGATAEERWRAAAALGKLGLATPRVVSALAVALKDKEAGVRTQAALALGKMADEVPDAVKWLTDALKDDDPSVQRVAAWSLGEALKAAEVKSPDSVKALLAKTQPTAAKGAAAKEAQAGVRAAAVGALGDLGAPAEGLLPATVSEVTKELTKGLNADESASVRRVTAWALGVYGARAAGQDQKDAVLALVKALGAGEWALRRTAATALGTVGTPAKTDAVEPLKELLDDERPEVRAAALEALRKIDPKAARGVRAP